MKPSLTLWSAVAAVAAGSLLVADPALAQPPPRSIPDGCVAHTSFNGGTDYPGDYRCAGLAFPYHADGVGRAGSPTWAGQWLVVDADGVHHVGTCTFNQGLHPTTDAAAERVTQEFPNDPGRAKGSYLTWKYGTTSDDLTAAAVWAVMHYYAADAAGRHQSLDLALPLVRSLDQLAANSGRADLQERALVLDREAQRNAGPWTMALSADRRGGAVVEISNVAGGIEGVPVRFVLGDAEQTVTTDSAGIARLDVADDINQVSATAEGPGELWVFRGQPAGPAGSLGQTIAVRGTPAVLEASVNLPPVATTTTTTTTTTVPETTTTVPETTTTTTTVPETTSTTSTSAETTSTTVPESTTTSTAPDTTSAPVTAAAQTPQPPPTVPSPTLPRTGPASMGVAYLATLALVGGIGLLGTLRRRVKPLAEPFLDWDRDGSDDDPPGGA